MNRSQYRVTKRVASISSNTWWAANFLVWENFSKWVQVCPQRICHSSVSPYPTKKRSSSRSRCCVRARLSPMSQQLPLLEVPTLPSSHQSQKPRSPPAQKFPLLKLSCLTQLTPNATILKLSTSMISKLILNPRHSFLRRCAKKQQPLSPVRQESLPVSPSWIPTTLQ